MRFGTSFVYLYILTILPDTSCTNTSTVCYGPPGLSCTTHRLSCPSPLVIQIINTFYGYRPECKDINGLSNCINTTCCKEEPGDWFISFSYEDDQRVAVNCNEAENCTFYGFRRLDYISYQCNDREVSAYSKIQYECLSKDKSTFTCPTTDSLRNYNSGIVGGVLGTLLIISVIINVGLVVYFTRKKSSSTNSRVENTYGDINITERDQTFYDGLHVQSAVSEHADRNVSNTHTYYNTTQTSQPENNDI